MNNLKFRETGGKDYKIVNLTKDWIIMITL